MYFEAISLTILASIIYELEDNQHVSGNGQKFWPYDWRFSMISRRISKTFLKSKPAIVICFSRTVPTWQMTGAHYKVIMTNGWEDGNRLKQEKISLSIELKPICGREFLVSPQFFCRALAREYVGHMSAFVYRDKNKFLTIFTLPGRQQRAPLTAVELETRTKRQTLKLTVRCPHRWELILQK